MPKVDYVKKMEERKQDIIEAFVAVYGESKRKHIEKTIQNVHLFFVRPLNIPVEEYESPDNYMQYANQFLANYLGVGAYELEEYTKNFVDNYPTIKKIDEEIKCVYEKITNKENVQENMKQFSLLTQEKIEEKERIQSIYRLDVMKRILIEQYFDGYVLELLNQEDILHDQIHLFHFLGATVKEDYNENLKEYDLYHIYFDYINQEKVKAIFPILTAYITKAQEEKHKAYDYLMQSVEGAKKIETFVDTNQVTMDDLSANFLFGIDGQSFPCYVGKTDTIEPIVLLNRDKVKDIILIHELTHAVETVILKKEYDYGILKMGTIPYICNIDHEATSYKQQCEIPYPNPEQDKKMFDIAEKENASVFTLNREYILNEVITQYLAEKVTNKLHDRVGKIINAKREDTHTTNLVDVLRPVLDSLQEDIVSTRIGKDWKALQKTLGTKLYNGLQNFCNTMIFCMYNTILAFQNKALREKYLFRLDTILPTLLKYEAEWDTRYNNKECQYFISQAKPLLDYMKSEKYQAYLKAKNENTTDDE